MLFQYTPPKLPSNANRPLRVVLSVFRIIAVKDGSVLLAKYLEHQAEAMLRDFDSRCPPPNKSQQPLSPGHERVQNDGVLTGEAGDTSNDNANSNAHTSSSSSNSNDNTNDCKTPPRLRVIELGCGTGLAGLAAAFSFGRRRHRGRGGDREECIAALPPPPRQTRPLEGEDDGVAECGASGREEEGGGGGGVEVVLTDLEYALTNARENISRNALSLEAVGSVAVKAAELDWCRPLPKELIGEIDDWGCHCCVSWRGP